MNALKDLRGRISAALTAAGVTVYDHVPERPTPPAAVITPGVPYIAAGDAFSTWRINLVVTLIARTATNTVATDALDSAITTAVLALDQVADVDTVGPYYAYSANGASYLAVDIDLYDINDLKET